MQKIVMGNPQDDPDLFIPAIARVITDERYRPFENDGVIWISHLGMPQITNVVDISTVGYIMLHLCYIEMDGGAPLQ